ncbi:MAG: hypothetical protein HQL36_00300 [Alphaproteobacteria bacterium]|nr:hypothetical protein [Alphaproteobacteria bacterium]MBF0249395.1 hypothetical protein [Alphaproteobacteria bacterium]
MNAQLIAKGMERLVYVVEGTAPKPGHGPLISALNECLADLDLKLVFSRKGWHRPGGVIDGHGHRIAENIGDWLADATSGDLMDLFISYEDAGLLATRLCGVTHYLTARTGSGPWDFLQVEVNELREVTDRLIFSPGIPPDGPEDIVEPDSPVKVDPTPLGPSFYRLRKARDIGEAYRKLLANSSADTLLVLRFFDEWLASSAAQTTFCRRFVLRVIDYKDRFGDTRLQATPVSTHDTVLPPFPSAIERGLDLARFLAAFDRAAGYPMAWYFLMVAGAHPDLERIAHAVHEDVSGVYDYLPERDIKVLSAWIQNPYRF